MPSGLVDVQSPGAIRSEQEAVDAEVDRLNYDIQTSSNTAFVGSWNSFREEWKQFFADGDSFFSRLFYSSYERTLEYRKRVNDWRAKFVDIGGHPTGPGLGLKPDSNPFSDLPSTVAKVAIGLAIAVAVLIIGYGFVSKKVGVA